MFHIKHMMSLGLILFMLSTMLVFTTGVASAHTTSTARAAVSCDYTSCDGKSPVSTGCSSYGEDIYTQTSNNLGGGLTATITLRYSSVCDAAWAKVTFSAPMPSGHAGDAGIKRNDGKYYECSAAGGDGYVLAGQTSCYSPMLADDSLTYDDYAVGFYWTNNAWSQVATTRSW